MSTPTTATWWVEVFLGENDGLASELETARPS